MNSPMLEAVRGGIAFIEANLTEDIGVSDVADAVSYSQFYFSREFSRLTHISVYDYILRRKLSESYKCLFGGGERIVDVAFHYGFQSHEVYTRAFRKMFGESPSEARVFKPLAVYEAIDGPYLEFLSGLRVEAVNEPAGSRWFEIDSAGGWAGGGSRLAVLSLENLHCCNCVLAGRVLAERGRGLAVPLEGLRRKLRVHHGDAELSFRYFIDNIYDAGEMGGNCILLERGEGTVEIYVSVKGNSLGLYP